MRKTVQGCITLALAGALVVPGVAQAWDGWREGKQTDPANDATVVDDGFGGKARLLDITAVHVIYDPGVGSLEADFDGSLNGLGKSRLNLYATVSALNADGVCDGVVRPGDFSLVSTELARDYIGPVERTELLDATGAVVAEGTYRDEDETGTGPELRVVSPLLKGLDPHCVSGVYGTKVDAGFTSESRDDVADFTIGELPAPKAPEVAPVAVAAPQPSEAAPQALVAPVSAASAPATAAPAPALLTSRGAKTVAARTLATKYGKAYRQRTARGYRLTCKSDGTAATCSVAWRTKGAAYAGKLTITRSALGDHLATAIVEQ